MKRLRMMITFVTVLAIVASAFTFKTKAGAWCVNSDGGSNCTTFLSARKIVSFPFGEAFKYYPGWDGDGAKCTLLNNGRCTATFRLHGDL